MIDLELMWAICADEIERRIRAGVPEWRGRLTLTTESETFLLDRRAGELVVERTARGASAEGGGNIVIPDWGIARLLLGKDDLRRAATDSDSGSELDQVLKASSLDRAPSFCLSGAV